jgi:hypothetical protein
VESYASGGILLGEGDFRLNEDGLAIGDGGLALPEEYAATGVRLHSCISSPGALDNMQPVEANNPFWMLIDNGCINDSTVNILERGPDGQIRFS